MTVLTDRFARAVDYARVAHTGQVRKGTRIPYLTHLRGVATLVMHTASGIPVHFWSGPLALDRANNILEGR